MAQNSSVCFKTHNYYYTGHSTGSSILASFQNELENRGVEPYGFHLVHRLGETTYSLSGYGKWASGSGV